MPSSSVTTIPNSSGLSTDFRPIVTAAPVSLCRSTRAPRSTSQSASPEMTRKVSSSRLLASRTEPGGAERQLLDRVLDAHAERVAVAEVAADRLRHEGQRDHDLVEAVPAQQLEDVLDARLADDRHHRLRLVRGERPQACPLPTRHDDRLHRATSRLALITYCAAAASASASANQKSQSGHSVDVADDEQDPHRQVEQPGRDLAEHRDVELVATWHEQLVPADEQRVTQEDDHRARPGKLALQREQDRRRVDHQPVGEWICELPELRLDVPAAREEAVDLIGHARDEEDPAGGPARAVVRADVDDDEDRNQREPQYRQRVRQERERCGDSAGGHSPTRIVLPRGRDRHAARIRQRSQPHLPACTARARRRRRLLGLARADAGGGRAADAGERSHPLRPDLPRDAGGRIHGRRRVPLPRSG